MTTGADHYREAEHLLSLDDNVATQQAIGHALLALSAATALQTTAKFLGDSPEVTDWARLIQPDTGPKMPPYPGSWPPKPGDVWQDRSERRWICLGTGYLANLAGKGDDAPEEIWRVYGPLMKVWHVAPTDDDEVPF